jgi:hypothetical protein
MRPPLDELVPSKKNSRPGIIKTVSYELKNVILVAFYENDNNPKKGKTGHP